KSGGSEEQRGSKGAESAVDAHRPEPGAAGAAELGPGNTLERPERIEQRPPKRRGSRIRIRLRTAARLGHDPVHDPELVAVEGVRLEGRGRLLLLLAVSPEDH